VDSYYQEIGRAGRDGEPARAILFYRPEDLGIHQFFAGGGKVDEEQVERVVEAVRESDEPVAPQELREETDLSQAKLTTALTRLEDIGAVEIEPTGEVHEAGPPLDSELLAQEALREEERRRETVRSRIDMMRGYAELREDCRREYILNYFGEPYDAPCGFCDNCQAGRVVEESAGETPFPLGSRVVHGTFGTGAVERYEGDKMVVLFDDVGYKTLLTEFVIETGALQPA
jgi:ATP-dependent DNA helicase RecQ